MTKIEKLRAFCAEKAPRVDVLPPIPGSKAFASLHWVRGEADPDAIARAVEERDRLAALPEEPEAEDPKDMAIRALTARLAALEAKGSPA